MTTATASGSESVSASSCNDCGTPSSVRMKSEAVSEKTTSPALVFTSALTSTKFERTERAGTCWPDGDCSLLGVLAAPTAKNQMNGAKANLNRFVVKFSPIAGLER